MVWEGAGRDTHSAAQGGRSAVSEKEVPRALSPWQFKHIYNDPCIAH